MDEGGEDDLKPTLQKMCEWRWCSSPVWHVLTTAPTGRASRARGKVPAAEHAGTSPRVRDIPMPQSPEWASQGDNTLPCLRRPNGASSCLNARTPGRCPGLCWLGPLALFASRPRVGLNMVVLACIFALSFTGQECRAADDALPLAATESQWAFPKGNTQYDLEAYVERDPDSPLSDKPILAWQGRGVGSQTARYDFGDSGRDLTRFHSVSAWMRMDFEGNPEVTWDQLFTAGGDGDGNIRIALYDEDGKSASAYLQKRLPEFGKHPGKWYKVELSLAKDFQGIRNVDRTRIRSLGIGFNVLNIVTEAELTYRFFFTEIEFSPGEVLAAAESKVYPGQFLPDNKLYLLKDYPSYLHLAFAADKKRVEGIDGPIEVHLDLPADIAFNAASGYLVGWDVEKPDPPVEYFSWPQLEYWHDRKLDIKTTEITRNELVYVRYAIPLEKSTLLKRLRENLGGGDANSGIDLYLSAEGARATTGQIYWQCEQIGLDWQSVDYEIMPALPRGPAPRRLVTTVWSGMSVIPEPLLPGIVSLYKEAGFNTYNSSGWVTPRIRKVYQLLNEAGITTYQAGQPAIYATMFLTDPDDKAYWAYKDGEINSSGVACLTYCAQRGERFIEALGFYDLAADFYPVAGLINDFEMGDTTRACYRCKRCLPVFAEYASLDPETLTPELIHQRHKEKFKEWHLQQNAQIAKHWIGLVKERNPDFKAIMCSAHIPRDPEEAVEYIAHHGTDPRFWDDVVDQHWPMMYYTGPSLYEDIDNTVKLLEKPVVPLLGTLWLGNRKYTYDQTELNVLACLAGGAQGYGFYIGLGPWDARYWDLLTRLSHLAAEIEDVILDGEDVNDAVAIAGVPADSRLALKVFQQGNRIVIGAINYAKGSVSPVIDLAAVAPTVDGLKTLYSKGDESTENVQLDGTRLTLQLDSEDAIFLELRGANR